METPVFLPLSFLRRLFPILLVLAAGICQPDRGLPRAYAMAPGVTTSSMPAGPATTAAGSVILAWDASPEPVTGYIVCWGGQSTLASPENSLYVGNVLKYTVGNLVPGSQYYFSVKALNEAGQSGSSNEITASAAAGQQAAQMAERAAPMRAGPGREATTSTTSSVTPEGMAGGESSTTTTGKQGGKKYLLGGTGKTLPNVQNTQSGAVIIFDGTEIKGTIPIDWPEYRSASGEARVATGDIDGDGFDEIVVGLGPVPGNAEIPGGKFEIFDDDFTSLGWGRIEWPDYDSANGESWPACGDIDGDGKAEILIGLGTGGNGLTEVFKFRDGKAVHEKWIQVGWDEYCAAGGGVHPACGNITADRKDEIVLGLYPAGSFLPEGKFEVVDGAGKELAWGAVDWPEYNSISGETRPACGTIDRAGNDEILLGLGEGSSGRIPVYSYVLGKLSLRTWLQAGEAEHPEDVETRLACGDVDGDGMDEVLIGFGGSAPSGMELHKDSTREFQLISRLQFPYSSTTNGEIYPAIKATDSKLPRVIDFLRKLAPE